MTESFYVMLETEQVETSLPHTGIILANNYAMGKIS